MFHPIGGLAVLLFHNGNMCHRCGGRSSMPMLLTGWTPNYIPGVNLFDLITPVLYFSRTNSHNQGLTQRMAVPCSSGTRLECDTCDRDARRSEGLMQWVNTYVSCKIFCCPLPEGCEPFRLISIF